MSARNPRLSVVYRYKFDRHVGQYWLARLHADNVRLRESAITHLLESAHKNRLLLGLETVGGAIAVSPSQGF
jgi:hypothetical protein